MVLTGEGLEKDLKVWVVGPKTWVITGKRRLYIRRKPAEDEALAVLIVPLTVLIKALRGTVFVVCVKMMRIVTLSALAVASVLAQDCSSSAGTKEVFGQYLSCMKKSIDQNYMLYENEIREHGRSGTLLPLN
ncbi:hypothetical protein OSTOST_06519 [Ostertagia ostertagi]